MKSIAKQNSTDCPCQSTKPYANCCKAIHQNIQNALTAESLMRARYTAYSMLNENFLIQSWHPETRPKDISLDPTVIWIGLDIKNLKDGEQDDESGEVEFIARCKTNGKASRIHEISQFRRHKKHWVYHEGELK